MTELTLTHEQTLLIRDANSPVRVRDATGQAIGYLLVSIDERPVTLTAKQLETIVRRLADGDEHYISTSELLERIKRSGD